MLPDGAARYFGVPFGNERQFRKDSELDVTRYFERGALWSTVAPFSSFVYVCVSKYAQMGWNASANTPLALAEFINVCEHLSDKNNWLSVNGVIS